MSEKWFIGDTHFGHRGIIEYMSEHRPFTDIESHDEALIKNWNEVVSDDDKVYHLGDFCLNRKSLAVAKRLKGRKILIMGNHDIFRTTEYLDAGFERVQGALQFENLILTHIPVHTQQLEHRFFANVHGHLHSNLIKTPSQMLENGVIVPPQPDWRYLNVSCEHINCTPITLEEVYSRIVEQQKAAEVSYNG